jgi:hypothetical protein
LELLLELGSLPVPNSPSWRLALVLRGLRPVQLPMTLNVNQCGRNPNP